MLKFGIKGKTLLLLQLPASLLKVPDMCRRTRYQFLLFSVGFFEVFFSAQMQSSLRNKGGDGIESYLYFVLLVALCTASKCIFFLSSAVAVARA